MRFARLLFVSLLTTAAFGQTKMNLPMTNSAQNSGPAPAAPPLPPMMRVQPGVPQGKISEKLTIASKVYDGMVADYWIYVPAQYDPKKQAALLVVQDGGQDIDRNGKQPMVNALDNLIAAGKIPVMISVFINPGDISGSPDTPTYKFVNGFAYKWSRTLKDSMRSTEYDTVSDRYDRYLRDDVLAEVSKHYNIRTDAYSRAITGQSSGGICSLNAAWQMPEMFSRVITWIGSFTALQWHEDPSVPDGGQDYPEKILREPHRNIRIWVQDGANDQENPRAGSWPLANIRVANALKLAKYDFKFSFGQGPHSGGEGAAEFPDEMIWLWRGYDPAKTSETYTQDPEEAGKPPFRVGIVNR